MTGDDSGRERQPPVPEAALWRMSRAVDLTPDEAERFLDLAGFAEGRLDADEHERVAERLALDSAAAADIAAARALAAGPSPEPVPERLVARAASLVDGSGNVISFRPRQRDVRFSGAARWGSLVAAMAVAGWLGFTLGMDTSRSFGQPRPPGEAGFLSELLDPSTNLMGDLTEGTRT